MKNRKILLALCLLMIWAGCNTSGKKAGAVQKEPLTEDEEINLANEIVFTKLLPNFRKIAYLDDIAVHDGKVYASEHWCKPEWNSVPVSMYGGFSIVGNALIYQSGIYNPELCHSDLQGGNVKVIADKVDRRQVWIAGDRVIYTTETETSDFKSVCEGVFWYDVHTSKSTKLLSEYLLLLSFDDDFVYYKKLDRENPYKSTWRVRWNGTGEETVPYITLPDDLYQVEGGHFYCKNDRTDPIVFSVFSVIDGDFKGNYSISKDDNILALKDNYLYYGNNTGIYKMDMNSGSTTKLADLARDVEISNLGDGFIIGDDLYFRASFIPEGDDWEFGGFRLYKTQLNGGKMEYQDMEWWPF